MKTTKIYSAIAILFTLFATSCSSDSDSDSSSGFTEENPFPRFLALTGYNGTVNSIANGSTTGSWGMTFQPTAKGKITALVIKLPAASSSLSIRIWDGARNVLRTEIVNIPTANVETVIPIEPLELQLNNVYTISMLSNSLYYRTRSDSGIVPFPITVDSIKFLSVGDNNGTPSHSFPYQLSTNGSYSGDVCFKFLRTE